MDDALGMVEIKGLASAIAVADVMVKTANVRLIGAERARGHGWTTIKIMGDVAAVTAAVNAGKQKAEECNGFVSSKVIPRPVQGVKEMFCTPQGKEEKKAQPQSPEKEEKNAAEKAPARKKQNTAARGGAAKKKAAYRSAKKAGTKPPVKTTEAAAEETTPQQKKENVSAESDKKAEVEENKE